MKCLGEGSVQSAGSTIPIFFEIEVGNRQMFQEYHTVTFPQCYFGN